MSRATRKSPRFPTAVMSSLGVLGCALFSAPAHASLTQVVAISGPYDFSIDGAGSVARSIHGLTINKPSSTATVYAV